MRSICVLALAGAASAVIAQNVHITADRSTASAGEAITWTVSITGLTSSVYLQTYDFNLNASDRTLGTASSFDDALTNATNPQPGTPDGADLDGASGGQSSVADPVALTYGDVTIGSFTVVAGTKVGTLSYGLTDGGRNSADIVRGRVGSDFGAVAFNGAASITSDSVQLLGVTDAPFTLHVVPSTTIVTEGETVVWTVSVSGDFGPDDFVQQYDLSFLASDPTIGVASTFMDNLDPDLGPTPGTVALADLTGVSGAQSSILGPVVKGPITLGTFAVLMTSEGQLTYTIGEGGQAPTSFLQIKPGSDFAPAVFNEQPNLDAGTVTVRELLPPNILVQPGSAVADAGDPPIVFTVLAEDAAEYRWRFNGVPLNDGPNVTGSTTPTLQVDPLAATEGTYDVVLSNFSGTTVSDPTVLAVVSACPADLTGNGVLNFDDIDAFIAEFLGGCP